MEKTKRADNPSAIYSLSPRLSGLFVAFNSRYSRPSRFAMLFGMGTCVSGNSWVAHIASTSVSRRKEPSICSFAARRRISASIIGMSDGRPGRAGVRRCLWPTCRHFMRYGRGLADQDLAAPEPGTSDHLELTIEAKEGPQLGPDVAAARRLLQWHCDTRGDQLPPGEPVHQQLRYPGAQSPRLFRARGFWPVQDDQRDVVLCKFAVPFPQFPRRPAFDRLPNRNPPVLRRPSRHRHHSPRFFAFS